MHTHERAASPFGRQKQGRTRAGRLSVAVAAATMLGLGAVAVPAFAADSKSPEIRLTAVDTDIVAVSGKYFPAKTKVSIKATTPTGEGKGELDSNAEGRILLGFQVPAGFKGKIDVVASTGTEVKASITVDVPAAPGTTTTTTAAVPAPSSNTPGVAAPDSVKSLPGADKVLKELDDYNKEAGEFNKARAEYGDRIQNPSADVSKKLNTFNAALMANNQKIGDFNTSMTNVDKLVVSKASESEIKAELEKSLKLITEVNDGFDDVEDAFDDLKEHLPKAGTKA